MDRPLLGSKDVQLPLNDNSQFQLLTVVGGLSRSKRLPGMLFRAGGAEQALYARASAPGSVRKDNQLFKPPGFPEVAKRLPHQRLDDPLTARVHAPTKRLHSSTCNSTPGQLRQNTNARCVQLLQDVH